MRFLHSGDKWFSEKLWGLFLSWHSLCVHGSLICCTFADCQWYLSYTYFNEGKCQLWANSNRDVCWAYFNRFLVPVCHHQLSYRHSSRVGICLYVPLCLIDLLMILELILSVLPLSEGICQVSKQGQEEGTIPWSCCCDNSDVFQVSSGSPFPGGLLPQRSGCGES